MPTAEHSHPGWSIGLKETNERNEVLERIERGFDAESIDFLR